MKPFDSINNVTPQISENVNKTVNELVKEMNLKIQNALLNLFAQIVRKYDHRIVDVIYSTVDDYRGDIKYYITVIFDLGNKNTPLNQVVGYVEVFYKDAIELNSINFKHI